MDREQEIIKAASDLNIVDGRVDFYAGANFADNHPKSPWHSVKDGELPQEEKDDAIDPPFLVKTACGDIYTAYYGLREEDREMCFFDDCGLAIEVDYWMGIPELPTE